ncbi:MAG: sensor histidine kinase [Treponema sp.]|nr:sensor histidine kinase [Treponema sp.]
MEDPIEKINELNAIIHNYTIYFIIFDIVFFTGLIIGIFILIKYLKFKSSLKTSSDYLRYVIRGQEEERARIARELHDTVAQDLRYCCGLSEKIADSKLEKEIHFILQKSVSEVRAMSYNLAPPDVTKVNLSANIMNLCQNFQEHSDAEFRMVAVDGLNTNFLSQEENFNIYRIVQEAMNNIRKHSRAKEVTVLLRNEIDTEEKGLYIFITDDGIGFDSQKCYASGDRHFGLVGMKQRAELIGAKIEISSEIGEGTQLSIIKLCK